MRHVFVLDSVIMVKLVARVVQLVVHSLSERNEEICHIIYRILGQCAPSLNAFEVMSLNQL